MILYEYEGKEILSQAGILVPKSVILGLNEADSRTEVILNDKGWITKGLVLKAQVLSGKRADSGGIIIVEDSSNLESGLSSLFNKEINGEKVEKILIEEKVDFDQEFYVSLSYDTDTRGPVLSVSEVGGTGIEKRGAKKYQVDPITNKIATSHASRNDKLKIPQDIIQKLIDLFFSQDCLLLEVNPLASTKEGKWVVLDAKVKLDDTALGRHQEDWNFPKRGVAGYKPSGRELKAKKIDEGDYRGVAGSTYFDLPGDIAILASGGGASLTAMDALIKAGGKAANYTEYSGNPPKEKVEKLTTIVLSKPGLHGLWIVGALANFTDIYETLSGFIDGLRQVEKNLGRKIDYPIVVRRAGPNDKKAFEMLKKQAKDFDLHLFGEETSISESAAVITKLAKEYKESSR